MDQFLSVQCIITDGDLPIEILWTFNNDLITPDQADITVAKISKRSSVLTIDSVDAKNAGKYSCQARNTAGSAAYSTELKVIGSFKIKKLF